MIRRTIKSVDFEFICSERGAKLASRFVCERRALEREKAGEADRDEGKDFGAAGIAGATLGQNVVLQGFVEEQLEAQE